jgi:4-aminobutyrate aminotransferase-like enzyme
MFENYTEQDLAAGRDYLMSGSVGGGLPICIDSGDGAVVRDIHGKEYIDCTSQAWTFTIGFGHPLVKEAVREQLDKISHVRTSFDTVPKLLLAKKLGEMAPGRLKKISFCLHGSNAIETAMKQAMVNVPHGMKFLTPYRGYAGRTFATVAASWPHHPISRLFGPFMEHVVRFPTAYCYRCAFGCQKATCHLQCAEFLKTMLDEAVEPVYAVIIEPVLAHGGMIDLPADYLRRMREICTEHGIMLIFDEIQTGFGRLGSLFAATYTGVVPDMLVFGKALGGGYPIAGVLQRDDLKPPEAGTDSYTFAHFPVSLAAAYATLRVIEEERIPEKAARMGKYFTARLRDLQNRYEEIGDIRGPGLMIGVELVKSRAKKEMANELTHTIVKEAVAEGVIFGESLMKGLGNVLKIKPPAVISEAQADKVLQVFEKLLVKSRKR